nr:hypothetical protein [Tanacetum cinerariifolium]
GAGRRLGHQADENPLGHVQHPCPPHLAKPGAEPVAARLPRIRGGARADPPARAPAQCALLAPAGPSHARLAHPAPSLEARLGRCVERSR